MISVAILTKNNQKTLKDVLSSLEFFSEILILDTGSTDQTVEIAKQFPNVKLFSVPFSGFGPLRNQAECLTKFDWILALDADEVLSPTLIEEIKNLSLDKTCVYNIPFLNFYNGKQIKSCGWYPESHIRLYSKQNAQFSKALVHEKLQFTSETKIVHLKNPIWHYPYHSTEDFLRKMQIYTSLFASQNKHKKKSSFKTAFFHGFFAFLKSYLFKRGIFDGKEGFIISLYNANTAFYKYIKLFEANQVDKTC